VKACPKQSRPTEPAGLTHSERSKAARVASQQSPVLRWTKAMLPRADAKQQSTRRRANRRSGLDTSNEPEAYAMDNCEDGNHVEGRETVRSRACRKRFVRQAKTTSNVSLRNAEEESQAADRPRLTARGSPRRLPRPSTADGRPSTADGRRPTITSGASTSGRVGTLYLHPPPSYPFTSEGRLR
jgi:hypothetical protein